MKSKQVLTTILLATILLCSGCRQSEETRLRIAQKRVDILQAQIDQVKSKLSDIQERQRKLDFQKKIEKTGPVITMYDRLPYMVSYQLKRESPFYNPFDNPYDPTSSALHMEVYRLEYRFLNHENPNDPCVLAIRICGNLVERQFDGVYEERNKFVEKSFRLKICLWDQNGRMLGGKMSERLISEPFSVNPTGRGDFFEVNLPISAVASGENSTDFPEIEKIRRITIVLLKKSVNEFIPMRSRRIDNNLLKPVKYYE